MDPVALIDDMATRARATSLALSGMATAQKAAGLKAAAAQLRVSADAIIAANAIDLAAAQAAWPPRWLID
jgi:glutamate-5-semialdehyde dehydrogenase